MEKACTKCGIQKPLEDFYCRNKNTDLRMACCRACFLEQSRKDYENNRQRRLQVKGLWAKSHRAQRWATEKKRQERPEVKEAIRLSQEKYLASLSEEKREANRAYSRRYFDENRERFAAWAKASRDRSLYRVQANIARARGKAAGSSGEFSAEGWLSLLTDCDWKCLCCGLHVSEIQAIYPRRKSLLEVDHIVPVSAGGAGDISNIQPLCQKCNNFKRRKTIDYRPEEIRIKYTVKS